MKAAVVRKNDGVFTRAIENIDLAGEGGSVLDVEYSSLNYKDALALTNKGPVVRSWPMVAGIDGAGRISQSVDPDIAVGDAAIVTGWGMGETRWGCYADQVRLDAGLVTRLPEGLSRRDAMAFGTAGLTAMLCIQALEAHGVQPPDGEVLVTGASGGVGGIAIMLLKKLGYSAVASTGRLDEADYLTRLGAASVIDRRELSEPGKPLQRERWAGVIDSVGSVTLANACASTRYGGVVAACGLAQGMDFPSSVAPFILRGVTLAGIDSVMASQSRRSSAWQRLGGLTDSAALSSIVKEIDLAEVFDAAEELLQGRVRGRLVVRVNSNSSH